MKVWTYWEGPRPTFLQLCLDTIALECSDCDYTHITPSNINDFIPEGVLHSNWNYIHEPALRSDCIRVALLKLYGGLYIDADTFMLKSPSSVIDQSKECCYFSWNNPPFRVLNGYIYCKPESVVADRWLDRLNHTLESRNVGWCSLGEQILTPTIIGNMDRCLQLPLSTFLPLDIDHRVRDFFDIHRHWEDYLKEHTIAFGLNYSWMMGRRPYDMLIPYENMRRSHMMIHRLICDMTQRHYERKKTNTSNAVG